MANLTIGNKSADSSYSLLLDANLKVLNSQAEEVDLISTAASVASDSLARLQAASVYTVYNAIPSWARSSTKPTYTAAEVGAVPTSRTINGQSLNSNVTLTAANVGAVPTSRKVNNYSINEDVSIQATDVPFTPTQDISATNVQDAIAELINGSEYEYTIHSDTASLYHESYKFANGILIENIHSANTVVTSSWNQSGGIYYIMYQPIAFANKFTRTPTAQISARGSTGNVNAWAWFHGGVTKTSTGNFFVGRGTNTATGTIVVMITAIGRWTEEISNTISVSSGGTSTSNYNDLTNKPQVNGNTLTGNKNGSTLGLVDLNQDATNSGKILAVGSDGIVAPTSTIDGNLNINGRITTPDEKGIISRSGVRPLYIQPNQTKTFALYPNSPAVIFVVRSGRDSIFCVTYWDSGARQLVGATTPSISIVHAASAGTFTIENQGTNWIGVIVLGATYEGEDEDVWR